MSIKVIGAGLGRTGTATLKIALDKLGFSSCDHMEELIKNPEKLKYWKLLYKENATNWEALFGGYQASVDYPSCRFYRQLFYRYGPDVKVILTVRDPQQWYESVRKTIYKTRPAANGGKVGRLWKMISSRRFRKIAPIFMFAEQLIWKDQFDGKFDQQAYAIQKFNEHIEEVKRTIPADRLLIYNVNEGWAPLCEFLDTPIPHEDFPFSNKGQDFEEKLELAFSEETIS